MKKVSIKIDRIGNLEADAQGFVGGACTVVMDSLKAKMGAAGENRTDKPELYAAETEQEVHASA